MKALSPYLAYLKPHRKWFFVGLLGSIIYGASSGAGIPAIINTVMRDVFEQRESIEGLGKVASIGIVLILVFILRGVFGFIGSYCMSIAGMGIAVALRQDLFDKLQALPLSFFERNKTGDLLTKVNTDAGAIQTLIIEAAADGIRQPATMLVAISYLIFKSFSYGEFFHLLLFCIALPALILPVKLLGKHLKRRGRQVQESQAEVMQQLNENLDTLLEVRSFGLEIFEKKAFHQRLEKNKTFQLKLKKYELAQQPIMELIVAVFIVVVFIIAFKKGITFSTFAELAAVLYFTFDPLKKTLKLINSVHKTEGSLNRVQEILNLRLPMVDPPHPKPLSVAKGQIAFHKVCFAYNEEPVLRNLSVTLEAGKSVALVGPSGAGKSTFAKLVPRFYDITEGTITIDQIDIRQVRQADLRRNIAVVSQQPVLFDTSLLENIRIGNPEATREQVEEAAKRAFVHPFIQSLEEGYETPCGERGDRLSGGQKQRIALARAFLKDAPILILDEATSALDSESERVIQEALKDLIQGKTVLIIAHRYSTIQHADRILVFDQGQIVEDGTHQELFQTDGLYKHLYQQQNF